MAIDENLLLVVKSAGLGEGEPDLAERLLGSLFAALLEAGQLPAMIVFMNSGVFVTTEGSAHRDALMRFEQAGTEIFSCLTCLDYYDRADKLVVGRPGNMRDTVNAMLSYAKVVTL